MQHKQTHAASSQLPSRRFLLHTHGLMDWKTMATKEIALLNRSVPVDTVAWGTSSCPESLSWQTGVRLVKCMMYSDAPSRGRSWIKVSMTARPSTQQARANCPFFTLLQQQIGKQQTRMIVPQTVESHMYSDSMLVYWWESSVFLFTWYTKMSEIQSRIIKMKLSMLTHQPLL